MAGLVKYRTTGAVTFGAGAVLGLSDGQAATRGSVLRQVDKGVYHVRQPVQFKAGEELAVEGRLPKSLADNLEAVARAARPRAPADEKALADGA